MTSQLDEKRIYLIGLYGVANGADAVAAQHTVKHVDLSQCLGLLQNESGGRNVFGGEPGACPKSWCETEVTQSKYTFYKLRRNMGFSPNGVGPTQLTDPGLQREAERRGGCWKPLHNMEVGFADFASKVAVYGPYEGARRYNGSGPAAHEYAERLYEWAAIWHNRFVRAGLAGIISV